MNIRHKGGVVAGRRRLVKLWREGSAEPCVGWAKVCLDEDDACNSTQVTVGHLARRRNEFSVVGSVSG